jgi:hypothetical protein
VADRVSPVYSSVLIASTAFTGEVAFEVPENVNCIVRDMDVTQKGPSVGGTTWAYDTTGVIFWAETLPSVIDLLFWTSWRGRQVIPGPGFFYMSSTEDMSLRASGYLLQGVI